MDKMTCKDKTFCSCTTNTDIKTLEAIAGRPLRHVKCPHTVSPSIGSASSKNSLRSKEKINKGINTIASVEESCKKLPPKVINESKFVQSENLMQKKIAADMVLATTRNFNTLPRLCEFNES